MEFEAYGSDAFKHSFVSMALLGLQSSEDSGASLSVLLSPLPGRVPDSSRVNFFLSKVVSEAVPFLVIGCCSRLSS